MTTPDTFVVSIFYPPRVKGQTTPVEGAHIGVPLNAYDLVSDGKGAEVKVDPPLSGTLKSGDVMTLWLQGQAALLSAQTVEDPDACIFLRIPTGRLQPDRVNELYYTVERKRQHIGTSEPALRVLYNAIRPGLKHQTRYPGGHSELALVLPDAIINGVGADFVSAQLRVSYPYCRAYDRISLKCNDEHLNVSVSKDEAPQPPNPGSAAPTSILLTVDRAFLEKARRVDRTLSFSFTVTDQLGNGPDPDTPWSSVQTVDENLGGH